jgi:hemerythrin-like domain-containing protein
MQLKRAEDSSPAQVFCEFMDQQGEAHFQAEERILLPGWLAADPGADPAMATRVQSEHLQLRAGARALRADASTAEELREIGQLLEAHVRFEERELFPLIEGALSEDALRMLGRELAEADSGCDR